MTITYPRDLLSYRQVISTFETVEGVSISRNARGKAIAAVEDSDAYWKAMFKTPPLEADERKAWSAWKKSLRGGLKTFLAWDASRKEPIAYPDGVPEILASTWDGKGTVDTIAAYLITAAGAPAGFTMTVGDHIGLVEGGKYGLFEVTETVIAGASTIAVPVEPAVPLTIFSTAATVVFRRPKAEFILLSSTWSEIGDASTLTPISFEAVQKL